MKADFFVLSSCPQNAHMFSSMILKVPMIKFSTPTTDKDNELFQLNGPTSLLAFDRLPLIGRSSKFKNMYYNLGITPAFVPAGTTSEEATKQVIMVNKATANMICN
mmetsp:Transcript_5051/g.7612  ORF Transcript_5051/g.7612 Transcript_5051/m.7612 type:complete len:106 (-) Transcript_5051:3-320(-)